ncbi:hypothetical protein VTK26DRAFT_1798 [Humicola hyalothermophila]
MRAGSKDRNKMKASSPKRCWALSYRTAENRGSISSTDTYSVAHTDASSPDGNGSTAPPPKRRGPLLSHVASSPAGDVNYVHGVYQVSLRRLTWPKKR